MTPTTCRSCNALIIWAVTEQGKRMPVNAGCVPLGNVGLFFRGPGQAPTAKVYSATEAAQAMASGLKLEGLPRYTSHFATCPNAGQHRKAKPQKVVDDV